MKHFYTVSRAYSLLLMTLLFRILIQIGGKFPVCRNGRRRLLKKYPALLSRTPSCLTFMQAQTWLKLNKPLLGLDRKVHLLLFSSCQRERELVKRCQSIDERRTSTLLHFLFRNQAPNGELAPYRATDFNHGFLFCTTSAGATAR